MKDPKTCNGKCNTTECKECARTALKKQHASVALLKHWGSLEPWEFDRKIGKEGLPVPIAVEVITARFNLHADTIHGLRRCCEALERLDVPICLAMSFGSPDEEWEDVFHFKARFGDDRYWLGLVFDKDKGMLCFDDTGIPLSRWSFFHHLFHCERNARLQLQRSFR